MRTIIAPCPAIEPGPIALPAGQTLWLPLRPGDAVVAAGPGITITEAPLWLADRCIERPVRLDVEARHVVDRGGWVRVQASHMSQITVLPRWPRGTWLARLVSWASPSAMRPAQALTR